MAKTYESFYLITVAHGRQGQIPYQYPPATANPEAADKLPRAKDLIALCFPDLDEIKKTRPVEFKAPIPDRPVASAAALLANATTAVVNATVSSSSSTSISSPVSREVATTKPGSRAEFSYFTLMDTDGGRLFGIVYRCFPNGFGARYDVGKRYPEALVFISRHSQSLPMFQQLLHLVHAMRLMHAPIDKIEWALSGVYNRPLPTPNETITLNYPLPKGHNRTYRFVWPAEGDFCTSDPVSALYLFQQLKPKSFVNLLTAIITERRICFMASDADKLTACVHASLSLVYPFVWQHPLIPVLSPPVAPYANSNSPIIFGIRRQHLPMLSQIVTTDVIYVDLDNGEMSWQEHSAPIPDIYILPNTSQVVQAAQKLGVEAAKAAEKLDKAFNKGMSLLQKYTGQQLVKDSEEPKPDAANVLAWDLTLLSTGRSGNPIPWSGKGRPSKTDKTTLADEQNLRDSLLAFMVAIVGDASTYLRPDGRGKLSLDKDFYLGSRGMMGDSPALTAFLEQMVDSSLFERFVDMRKAQVDRDRVASPRSDEASRASQLGVFLRCVETLKQRPEVFTTSNIKKALKASAKETSADSETSGRWTLFHEGALQLTSNYAVTNDAPRALSSLLQDSFSSALLPSILRALWSRLSDCKGLNWRHASKGLTLLRELLIRGPEQVFSDALANIGLLRTFLEYRSGLEGLGQGNKVKETARDVFFLLLEGKQYLLLRANYWNGKKKLNMPRIRLTFEHALSTSFGDLHRVVVPSEGPQQAPNSPSRLGSAEHIGPSSADSGNAASLLGGDDDGYAGADLSAFSGGDDEEPLAPARLGGMASDSHLAARTPNSSYVASEAVKPPGKWENFDGTQSSGGEAAAWEGFGAQAQPHGGRPSAIQQAPPPQQWVSFNADNALQQPAPIKPDRRPSAQAPEGSISPPLIQLSTSPPAPPLTLPPSLPPLTAQRPPQPVPVMPLQQPYPTAAPAYGMPQAYGAYAPTAGYGQAQAMGGPGLAMYPPQQPYSATYDPFADLLEKDK